LTTALSYRAVVTLRKDRDDDRRPRNVSCIGVHAFDTGTAQTSAFKGEIDGFQVRHGT
jgi:hypothetical protein